MNQENTTQETPEVMSSSDSPSSYDIMAQNYDDWQQPLSSSAPPPKKIDWSDIQIEYLNESKLCTTESFPVIVAYTVYKDSEAKAWRPRVAKGIGKVKVKIYLAGYRDPYLKPPTTEAEAIEAVNTMNAYLFSKQGKWHTVSASEAHELHHVQAWKDTNDYFWENMKIQKQIEGFTVSEDSVSSQADAEVIIKNRRTRLSTL